MSLPKLKKTEPLFGGGIVRIFEDTNLVFSGEMMEKMQELHNMGYSFEEIGESLGRDPDEVFLALFHMARQGKEIRAVGKRFVV